MNETLRRVCALTKQTKSISKSIVSRLTGILPLVKRLEVVQAELTELRKTLQAVLKKVEPVKPLDPKLELFKEVGRVLEPSMLKKRDLVAKLEELGIQINTAFDFLLGAWRKDDLFNTSFGYGWYCLSAKGRNVAGLPPKSANSEGPFQPGKSLREIQVEEEISALKDKLQKAEARVAELETKPVQTVPKPPRKTGRTLAGVKNGQPRALSQLDLVVLGLYEARPRKLKREEVKSWLEKKGKTATPNSLIVLLTNTGSKGMICSLGKRGDLDYLLTEKGEARGRELSESQPPPQEKSGEPVPSTEKAPVLESVVENTPQPAPEAEKKPDPEPVAEEKSEPAPVVEKGPDWYALKKTQLTDEHYGILDMALRGDDVDSQRLYKVEDGQGNLVWIWWGLCDDFPVPDQPLLGHLLKYGILPPALELPARPCLFKVEGKKIQFDPSEKVHGRVIEFAQRKGRLPPQISS